MTTTDYILNAVLVFVVLRQARERVLDTRSWLVPLSILAYVAHMYVHTIPTSGNDLVLVAALAGLGLALGVAGGFATQVRVDRDGVGYARVGWIAGFLLIAGISARMIFVFGVNNGFGSAIRHFSITNHLSVDAWPMALVSMAILEVATRIILVQVRARRMAAGHGVAPVAIPAAA